MAIDIASPGGSAADLKAALRASIDDFEFITSGADPVAADPDVAFTFWQTGRTKGPEEVTLADHTGSVPFLKTIRILNTGLDAPQINFGSSPSSGLLPNNPWVLNATASEQVIMLLWTGTQWTAVVGSNIVTNGGGINFGNGALVGEDAGEIVLASGDIITGGQVKAGTIRTTALPTSLPGVTGEFWDDTGTVKIKE